ncbi:BAG domain-containing protein [Elsinoe fawcettii]|nr:BAG domain-containing protein [Elsinoe fawcettii]
MASGWAQRISQLSGRWSPFARSPTENGQTKVSDADYSYITTEDLQKGDYDRDSGPPRETDVLTIKNKKTKYPVHFPAYSIDRGELTIGDVRKEASKKLGCDVRRIKLLHRGKKLNDDQRSCREEGLRDGLDIMCVTGDTIIEPDSSSDSEGGLDAGEAGGEQPKRKRNRNRNKKKKNKKRGDTADVDGLAVPGSESSRTASPKPPPTPKTPIDKLNALHDTMRSFIPLVGNYVSNTPTDPKERDFEHKKLSETILAQILLKLDAVETDEPEARARRKELVRETQKLLNDLDAAKAA